MIRRSLALFCSVVWLGSACVTTGPTTSSELSPAATPRHSGSDPKYVCEYEATTGSHIPEKICRPVEQVESDRRAAQEFMHRAPVQSIKGN